MHPFTLNGLDHVAINVKDMEASAAWYNKVLGLKQYKLERWGAFPIFLLSGKIGIALFPAKLTDPELSPDSDNIKIDHFAFNASAEEFAKARQHYDSLNLEYTYKDHHYYDSLYTNDPDGHIVELTTMKVDFLIESGI